MSRYKLYVSSVLMLFLLHPAICFAEKNLVNLSYWNWSEEMQISGGGRTTDTPANFGGLGIEFERSFTDKPVGWNLGFSLINGQATGGQKTNPSDLVYFASYQKFMAMTVKVSRFSRLYQRVYVEFGPLLLYRSFSWPSDNGLSAQSGSSFNFGYSLDLRFRLAPKVDFCQSIGSLMTKASTIWSLGFGYRF